MLVMNAVVAKTPFARPPLAPKPAVPKTGGKGLALPASPLTPAVKPTRTGRNAHEGSVALRKSFSHFHNVYATPPPAADGCKGQAATVIMKRRCPGIVTDAVMAALTRCRAWMEKQEAAFMVWLNHVLAPGHEQAASREDLASLRVEARARGLLWRLYTEDAGVIAVMVRLERRIDDGFLRMRDAVRPSSTPPRSKTSEYTCRERQVVKI